MLEVVVELLRPLYLNGNQGAGSGLGVALQTLGTMWWTTVRPGRWLELFPQGSKYPIIIYSPKSNLHNYYPKAEYLIIGSFGPLGFGIGHFRSEQEAVQEFGLSLRGLMTSLLLSIGLASFKDFSGLYTRLLQDKRVPPATRGLHEFTDRIAKVIDQRVLTTHAVIAYLFLIFSVIPHLCGLGVTWRYGRITALHVVGLSALVLCAYNIVHWTA